jgi:hypothetical protein
MPVRAMGFLLPLVFAVVFVLIAGSLSRLAQPGIIAGQFPRRADHPIYALRRIYGTAWTRRCWRTH